MDIVENDIEHKFERMICTLSPNHSSFYKEGNQDKKSLTGTIFFVVIDDNGSEWLLKDPSGGDAFEDNDARENRVWQSGISEVYAAIIARYIGYPTALAKLVITNIEGEGDADRPFLAYSYLTNAMDINRIAPEFFASVENVANLSDIHFRPILNWLLGSHTDNGRQGVISGIEFKKYYAIDMIVSANTYKPSHSQSVEHMHAGKSDLFKSVISSANCDKDVHKNLGICMSKFIDVRSQKHVQIYFDRISELRNPEFVVSLLEPKSESSERIAYAISERADAIIFLYEQRQFHKIDQ